MLIVKDSVPGQSLEQRLELNVKGNPEKNQTGNEKSLQEKCHQFKVCSKKLQNYHGK